MLSEKSFALRDAIDQVFDTPVRGPAVLAFRRSIGERIAETAPIADLDYLLHYIRCRQDGCNARLADMLASGQPPMSSTDREFLEGHCCGNQFDYPGGHQVGDVLKAQANAAGVNVTGKVYVGGLAAFPGDPQAWVSDRHDVKRVLTERGWGSEGAVNQAPRTPRTQRERALPKLLKGGAKAAFMSRLKAKGLSGDLLKGSTDAPSA